jgi:hypothetical protein
MLTNQIERVLAYLDGENGKQRYLDLIEKAQRMVLKRRWCTADGSLPGGRTTKDVVEDVLKAVLSSPREKGHRTIDDDIDLEAALVKITQSYVSHAAESLENRSRAKTPAPDLQGNTVFDTSKGVWEASANVLSEEDQNAMRERCDAFLEFAKKDKIVYSMLVLIRDKGIDRPAEVIAKELRISVLDVYNARKRLDTLVRSFTQSPK